MMRKTKTFHVPSEVMVEFASMMEEYGLENSIMGSENDAVLVEVEYEPEERNAIFEIMELLDEEI